MAIILFHMKDCKECDKAKDMLKGFANVVYIEASFGDKLLKEYNVTKFPTLIYQRDDDYAEPEYYVGLDGVQEFAELHNDNY